MSRSVSGMLVPAIFLAAASFAGFLLVPWLDRNPTWRAAGTAFAAGTLLTIVLAHLLPEAMHDAPQAPATFVVGFVAMMLLHQHVLKADPCCGHEHQAHAGWPSYAAMALCSFNDGIVSAPSALEHGIAAPTLWGMAIHKITSSFALVMLLRGLGSAGRTIGGAVSMAAFSLITPATLLGASAFEGWRQPMAYVLAASGGALLYVVAGSMVPRVEHVARERRGPILAAFLLGVLGTVVFGLLEHGHPAHA
jgi:zinc transporter ZupT